MNNNYSLYLKLLEIEVSSGMGIGRGANNPTL
jgi:hypothetical protein